MPGLGGGFAGRGLTDFGMTAPGALHIFPQDISDPLYAIRRYLCLEPRRQAAAPLSSPVLSGLFIPVIIDETLIISEPWEDLPLTYQTVIFEPWEYPPPSYSEVSSYIEPWGSGT